MNQIEKITGVVTVVLVLCVFLSLSPQTAIAQEKEMHYDVPVKVDESTTTNHEVTIKGKKIPYSATVGNQPVWDEDGKPIATLLYTYYERTDIEDKRRRPLVVSFNGGPGSASVWMHLGYTGPKKLRIWSGRQRRFYIGCG